MVKFDFVLLSTGNFYCAFFKEFFIQGGYTNCLIQLNYSLNRCEIIYVRFSDRYFVKAFVCKAYLKIFKKI